MQTKESTSNGKKTDLSESVIWILLILLCMAHGALSISNSVISAAVTIIKTELNLSDTNFGMLGTVSSVGGFVASLLFSIIVSKFNHKTIIIFCLLFNALSQFPFFMTQNYYVLLFSRLISGISSVMCFIFFPMWTDNFAIERWKSFMMTSILISYSIGELLGYLINAIIDKEHWRYGIFLQSGVIFVLISFMSLISSIYFDKKYSTEKEIASEIEKEAEKKDENVKTVQIKSKLGLLKEIFGNIPYLFITLFKGNKYFVNGAIGYWFVDYVENVFKVTDKGKIFYGFTVAFVVSYFIGMVLGGSIMSLIKGFQGKKTIYVMIGLYFICCIFSVSILFSNGLTMFTIMVLFRNIFGAICENFTFPISFAVVPPNLKGEYSGIGSLILNITGFLPSAYFYGFLKSYYNSSFMAMIGLIIYALFGIVELVIVLIFLKENEKNKKKSS